MWILPTYNRPHNCRAVLEQIISVGCSTEGLVIVNGVDCLEEYRALRLPEGWSRVVLSENIGVCAAMNFAFEAAPREPFYGLICDDEYVFTPDWDQILINAAGSKYISFGNDHWQSGQRQHGYVTWGGDLVRATGFLSLPGLWHWFHDHYWETIAATLGINRFCKDVMVEHRHYMAGHAPKDATYESGESRAAEDYEVFHDWMENELVEMIERLTPMYQEPTPCVLA